MGEDCKPSIKDNRAFDADFSATRFKKAMRGMGSDEKMIISQLISHSSLQRQEIEETFKKNYGQDLIEALRDELGGHFEETVVALLTSPYDLLTEALHGALKGIGTDESILTEVLCCRSAEEIDSLKVWYEKKFGESLDEALKNDLSGDFQALMRSLVSGGRPSDDETENIPLAKKDAQDLYDAGVGYSSNTDESEFIRILNTKSFSHLRETFRAYDQIAQQPIQDAIEDEFSGDMKTGLLAIVDRVMDPAGFFCKRLHKSMDGPGTDDKTLIRIIVSRSEIDLASIRERYKDLYSQDLVVDVEKDTAGDYGRLLVAIIKGN
ncbi:annexin A13-like isoform X1 [Oratosquilla oratoria]|uniref:annexin A13-like isoform X1 n=1 Tax=Oratosquilla oratoria TaxID=337810 RepID=UPI003F7662D8